MSDTPVPKEPPIRLIALGGYVGLAVGLLLCLAFAWYRPEDYGSVWKLILVHLAAGRAGNVALGIELAVPRPFLFAQCFLQDVLALLLFYPLVIAGYNRAARTESVGAALAKVRRAAENHKRRIQPFGAIGLVAFVVFPLFSTGPLVGAVIGYLLGIRTIVAFASVVAGNAIAVALWVWFFEGLKSINPAIGRWFLVVLIAAAVLGAVYSQARRILESRRHPENSDGSSDSTSSDP